LPARVSIARGILPKGVQTVQIDSDYGTWVGAVEIGGKTNIVPIRLLRGAAYIGQKDVQGDFTPNGALPDEADPAESWTPPNVPKIVIPVGDGPDEPKGDKKKSDSPVPGAPKLPKSKLF